jgi:hypothetical protein
MKLKLALAALLVTGISAPALADFYVVQDHTTKRCTVVKEKPAGTSVTILGDGTVYKSETEAEGYIKKTKVCTQE